jgi:hypothetical protein
MGFGAHLPVKIKVPLNLLGLVEKRYCPLPGRQPHRAPKPDVALQAPRGGNKRGHVVHCAE